MLFFFFLRQGLSLAWSSMIRIYWLGIQLRSSADFSSVALELQAFTARPGLFVWVLGTELGSFWLHSKLSEPSTQPHQSIFSFHCCTFQCQNFILAPLHNFFSFMKFSFCSYIVFLTSFTTWIFLVTQKRCFKVCQMWPKYMGL